MDSFKVYNKAFTFWQGMLYQGSYVILSFQNGQFVPFKKLIAGQPHFHAKEASQILHLQVFDFFSYIRYP